MKWRVKSKGKNENNAIAISSFRPVVRRRTKRFSRDRCLWVYKGWVFNIFMMWVDGGKLYVHRYLFLSKKLLRLQSIKEHEISCTFVRFWRIGVVTLLYLVECLCNALYRVESIIFSRMARDEIFKMVVFRIFHYIMMNYDTINYSEHS